MSELLAPEALKSSRQNGRQRLLVVLIGLVAVILLGSIVSLVIRHGQAKPATTVALDANGKLDAAESLGASLGIWEYVVLVGHSPSSSVRQDFTSPVVEYARALAIPLNAYELNKANSVAATSIAQRVANIVQEMGGSQARGVFELRLACTYAEMAVDTAAQFDVNTGHMYTLIAASSIDVAVGDAQSAGIDSSIVDKGRSIAQEVRHIETQTPFMREQIIHEIFLWEDEARYAMRGIVR